MEGVNYGHMAKLITEPVTVTIEHGDTRATYSAHHAILAGDLHGGTNIEVPSARRVNLTTKPKGTEWAPTLGINITSKPQTSPEEKALIEAAKAQERALLQAARLVEQAQEKAEAVINDADHSLNMAIQAFLHSGKTSEDVARVLDAQGIYANEVRVNNVATGNTEDLYLLDATELLTVG
jgi:selenocysteine lyase/cysteine desulfurase